MSGVETLEALSRLRLTTYIDHASTGSAASLAFLRDGDLPGLQAIRRPIPV
jgi:3-phosphoglycerate kinase